MRRNPAHAAWTVLLISFLICALLAISVPLATRWYLLHAMVLRPGLLQVTSGTVLMVANDSEEPIAVINARTVENNYLIQTDHNAQATLSFPANEDPGSPELATVQIYTNAQVRLAESTRPRFTLSRDPRRVVLEVMGGRVRINTAELQPWGLYTEVRTPQATIFLGPGSYSVDVTNDQTQVSTRAGQATVEGNQVRKLVGDGFSSFVPTGKSPTDPTLTADNLISNGDFQEDIGPPNWLVSLYPENDPSAGNVQLTTASGRRSARFSRLGQPPTHTEVGITQVLEHSVRDYEYLNLELDVLLREQSLPGAGEQSSEFPLMFWLDYDDIYGTHQFWTHGFYYQDPPEQWVVTGGEKIVRGVWFPFESGNLFEHLPMEGRPPPANINWIKIYASGHNYDSLVSEVRLIAR